MNVLVLNAGSSSLKFQVIATDPDRIAKDCERLSRGLVERIGGEAIVTIQNGDCPRQKSTAQILDIPAALRHVLGWLMSDQAATPVLNSFGDIHAIGHRIVHGGELFNHSALITPEVLKGIEDCIDLAPLHNPANLKGIAAGYEIFGRQIPQVAVFDTAFHTSIPEHAYLYAIPYHLYRRMAFAGMVFTGLRIGT